ncbi:MAG: hypothetical protein KIS66_08330 [Fimbriimonadaceae bacterium]|nr:hypothetical protein [Fimbriimonadaceae bacterium]
MLTCALPLLLVGTGRAMPAAASVTYPGVPYAVSTGTDTLLPVQLKSHSVTIKLGTQALSYETISVFKNHSDKPIRATLTIPFAARGVLDHRDALSNPVLARWDRKPITFARPALDMAESSRRSSGEPYDFDTAVSATVTFEPNSTHSLVTSYRQKLGKAGPDGALRTLGYGTGGLDKWQGPCERLNYSVQFLRETFFASSADTGEKYEASSVFAVHSTEPQSGWKIGDKGAFVKFENRYGNVGTLWFTFYPNGYRRS